jgi:hypothetical protein
LFGKYIPNALSEVLASTRRVSMHAAGVCVWPGKPQKSVYAQASTIEQEESLIRLGIIGAGAAVERLHLPVLAEMSDDIRVVAVACRRREKAEAVAALIIGNFSEARQWTQSSLPFPST